MRPLGMSGARARTYAGTMYARRRHRYFVMMGICIALFVLSWGVVRLWSVPAAVAMCVVAMVIPPLAAVVANRRGPDDRWWDDPSGDPQSDEWWEELDGKKGRH
ncbi:membrane protein [Streptomyces mutabilis]|nr:membrane protein [Streptomyces mutabilis]